MSSLSLRKEHAGIVVGSARIYSTSCLFLVIDGSERTLTSDWEDADKRVHGILEERDTHQSGLARNIYLREEGDQVHRDRLDGPEGLLSRFKSFRCVSIYRCSQMYHERAMDTCLVNRERAYVLQR